MLARERDCRHPARKWHLRVQETIYPEVLRRVGDVGEREVECKQDDHREDVDPRMRKRAWDHNLNEGHDGVEGVLGDVGPAAVLAIESSA